MTPAEWRRVTEIYDRARAMPAADREAFLARECSDDQAVRAEVASLLAADRDDDFLERGAVVKPRDLLDMAAGIPSEAAAVVLADGQQLGPYVVERLLARGGMGVLYVARDPRLGRRVTLKVLPPATAGDVTARERLQREARTAARLRHPHVVSVHALEDIDDLLIIVAEYVEGPTLADVIAAEGPLPRDRWHAVARALASALAAAHDAHVVHRDVKASNVVMGRDGLRLVDFGIATTVAEDGASRLTRTGQFTGTPLAMAPEQLEGGDATPLADQYAYGLVLYEAACGRLPFGDGPIAGVWTRMLRDEPAPLAAHAPQLTMDDIVLVHRCLARVPAERFASMHDVLQALDAATAGSAPPEVHRSPQRSEQGAGGSPQRSEQGEGGSPQRSEQGVGGWWDVHQAATSVLYAVLLWPGWLVAETLAPPWRASAQLALVCVATVAASLRLHLWFSARQYPRPLAAARRRFWPAVASVDAIYAILLASMAIHAAASRILPAVIAAGLAVCLLMASFVIEPATRRAEGG